MQGVPSRRVSSQAKPAGRRGPGRNEEVKRSPPGKETPKSEHEAESGGPAARAHSCPGQISWARDLRGAPSPAPSPGQPERAAARLRELRERSRAGAGVHTPEGQGGAGAQGLPSGAGRAPGLTSAGFSSVLSRPRRPRPAPASCSQSGRGAALSSTAQSRPLLASVRCHPPGCPSVSRRRSARARTVPCGRSATFLHSGTSTPGPLRRGRASGAGTWQCSFPGRAANHIGPA